jgi:lambda family phage tail tape measure protein
MAVDKRESRLELTAVDQASAVIKKVKGSVEELRSSVDTVKDAMLAVGVVVGAGAMGKLYLDIVKADAALVDFSAETGSSIENLSKISAIAKIGGNNFEGFTDQLARMVKGLKSGNDEGQLASRALTFLGISAKDANGVFRDTGDIAFDVAKALKQYADDGNKVALVQDALGKGAQKYLPLLKDMAQFGDTAATTTAEQAKQAKEFEIAINRVNLALEHNRRTLVVEYVPALTRFLEQMSEGIRIAGGFGAAMLNFGTMNPNPGAAIASANLDLERLYARKQSYHDPAEDSGINRLIQLAEQRRQFSQFLQRQNALEGRTGDENLDARDLRSRGPAPSSGYQSADIHQEEQETRLYIRALQQLEEELGKLQDMSKAQIVINRLVAGSWQAIKDPVKQAALIAAAGDYDDKQLRLSQQKQFVDMVTIQAQVLDRSRQAVDDMRDANLREAESLGFDTSLIMMSSREREKAIALRRVDLQLRADLAKLPRDLEGNLQPGAVSSMSVMMAVAEAQKEVVSKSVDDRLRLERSWAAGTKGAFDEYSSNATNAALQARMVFGNAFQNMEDALVNFARTGKLNFRNFADSLINDILRIQTRMYITGPLAQMGSDLFSSALPAIGSGIGSLFGFANGGVMGGGGSMPLTRYAGGGVATSPQLAMFGEGATPEAFVPLPDGRSIPVQMRGTGGGAVNKFFFLPIVSADHTGFMQISAQLQAIDSSIDVRAVAAIVKAAASRGKRLL